MTDDTEILTYNGEPIEKLTREELIDALVSCSKLLFFQRKSAEEIQQLAELKYTPKTAFGRMLQKAGML